MQKSPNSWENKLHNLYLKKCDRWFAYTSDVEKYLLNHNYPKNKITNVQNAIDTVGLKESYDKIKVSEIKELKTTLNIKGNKVAIFCGAMYAEKRISFILECCDRIKASIPDFHMIFIGAGIESCKVKMAAELKDWIHYVGPKFGKERLIYFKISSIQLMPQSVGLAILDSFALQTPIVTTNCPYHGPEIAYLENGINGVITNDTMVDYSNEIIKLFPR